MLCKRNIFFAPSTIICTSKYVGNSCSSPSLLALLANSRHFSSSFILLAENKVPSARFTRRRSTRAGGTLPSSATKAAPQTSAAPSSMSTPLQEKKADATKDATAPLHKWTSDASTTTAEAATSATPAGAAAPQPNETNSTTFQSPPQIPVAPPMEKTAQRLFVSWQQGVVASIGAVMGIGFLLYFFYAPVKEDTVHHTVKVASEALNDVRLKNQAIHLSKEVVNNVISDPKSLDLVSDLVFKLLAADDTKIAVSSLLQSLFEDHYTQEVTKKFVLMIVRDPWIQEQIQKIAKEQVLELLQDADIRAALSGFLLSSAQKSIQAPELHFEVARAVRHSVASLFNPWWS